MAEGGLLKDRVQKDVVVQIATNEDAVAKLTRLVDGYLQSEFAKPGNSTREVLQSVCHGALSGLILNGVDVNQGTIQILQSVGHVLQERSGDPMKTMSYALDGMARVANVVNINDIAKMRASIDSQFMGAGDIFNDLASKYR